MENKNYIQGLKLIGWQKVFASTFQSLESDDILVIKAPRQRGKSTVLCQALLYTAINRPGSQSFFISPTNNQCRKQFNDIKDSVVESPLVLKLNESTQEIIFVNNSKIFFRSAESGDNLRGNTVRNGGILVIDEAAFIKDDVFGILIPYVTVSHAPIILISTPRRKNGTFYDWWTQAINRNVHFKYIDVNDYPCDFFITDEQKKTYEKILSPEKYKNEILGLFTELSEGVFGNYRKNFKTPTNFNVKYVGIDWSTTGNDKTVIVGFNDLFEMCYLWTDKSLEPLKRVEKIAEILNGMPHLSKIVVEQNSIGAVYHSVLKSLYKNPNIIDLFVTSNSSKREIIEKMIEKLGKDEITLLDDKELEYEMSIYIQQPLSGGGYTYNADPKASNSHDDIIMATAMCIKAFTSKSGSYSFGYAKI